MHVNMKNALTPWSAVVDGLHGPRDGFAADPCPDSLIIHVLIVRNWMIAIEKYKLYFFGDQSGAPKHETDPFCGERMCADQVLADLFEQLAGEFYADSHFSFTNPVM
jgi:hypothetical protein